MACSYLPSLCLESPCRLASWLLSSDSEVAEECKLRDLSLLNKLLVDVLLVNCACSSARA